MGAAALVVIPHEEADNGHGEQYCAENETYDGIAATTLFNDFNCHDVWSALGFYRQERMTRSGVPSRQGKPVNVSSTSTALRIVTPDSRA